MTALKYFCEDAREYHVIAAGSYMGIARHAGTSYPVGKVDTLTLRPMDFTEYLRAIGRGMMADAISDGTGIADLDSAKRDLRREAGVVPEFLRTLVFARPRGDDQFADCTFSPSLDMSR
nr:AAA family ATPase [Bifidobacterium longum]